MISLIDDYQSQMKDSSTRESHIGKEYIHTNEVTTREWGAIILKYTAMLGNNFSCVRPFQHSVNVMPIKIFQDKVPDLIFLHSIL